MDAVGSNIVLQHRTGELFRCIPKMNDDVNEEWISDKTRFAIDGLKYQRLVAPMAKVGGQLVESTWEEVLFRVAEKLRQASGTSMAAIVGTLNDAESTIALKDLFNKFNSEHVYTEGDFPIESGGFDLRSNYLLNDRLASVENCDALLLVGTNPRYEAPVFNARIRKAFLHTDIEIGVVGSHVDLTYDYEYLGDQADVIDDLLSGKSEFSKKLSAAQRPLIVVGVDALKGDQDGGALLGKLQRLAEKVRGQNKETKVLNILHRSAGQVAALDLGLKPASALESVKKSIKLVYLLGADELKFKRSDFADNAFIIYQGHHGDAGAEIADVILPGGAYTEKDGTYVNTEGRAQKAYPAVLPPGDARTDWKIIRAVSEVAGKTLPYDSIQEIRNRLSQIAPHLTRYGIAEESGFLKQALELGAQDILLRGNKSLATKQKSLEDFWLTNTITRASPTMAECVRAARQHQQNPHLDPLTLSASI
uniref:NADH-ubiquinone oxidoreductase 75 kDa subunit, mitochondrial n=1 Tax=Acrobeloides nanus TaxID=290746 RepID=A0A914DSF9_9BILA